MQITTGAHLYQIELKNPSFLLFFYQKNSGI